MEILRRMSVAAQNDRAIDVGILHCRVLVKDQLRSVLAVFGFQARARPCLGVLAVEHAATRAESD